MECFVCGTFCALGRLDVGPCVMGSFVVGLYVIGRFVMCIELEFTATVPYVTLLSKEFDLK